MIDPVVLNVLATSGRAPSTVVDPMGASKPQKVRTQVIITLRWEGSRS
jgi:hypothetical protein